MTLSPARVWSVLRGSLVVVGALVAASLGSTAAGAQAASTNVVLSVSGTSSPSGGGYWLVAGDGGVFSFGDAVGADPPPHLNKDQALVARCSGSTASSPIEHAFHPVFGKDFSNATTSMAIDGWTNAFPIQDSPNLWVVDRSEAVHAAGTAILTLEENPTGVGVVDGSRCSP